MRYQPPAKSPAPFWPLLKNIFKGRTDFEQVLGNYLSAKSVVIGDAWVVVLAEGLKALGKFHGGRKIILPAYSCNEFTKAILLAGMEPLYVDLADDFSLQLPAVKDAMQPDVLGILMVNNTGVVADNAGIRAFCDAEGIFAIEDAGYTLFGMDEKHKPYGSFGHVSIINMSEGKIIPVGGAAWVVNHVSALSTAEILRTYLSTMPPRTLFNEALMWLIYRLGSSAMGFHLYYQLKRLGLGDLKAKFSNEPTRKGEDYASGELLIKNGKFVMQPEHANQLARVQARAWNKIRSAWAVAIYDLRSEEMKQRLQRVALWKTALGERKQKGMLAAHPMVVKLPWMMFPSAEQANILEGMGIKKQYPPSWPMNMPAFPNAQKCYEQVHSLPVHAGITERSMQEAVKWIKQSGMVDGNQSTNGPQQSN